MFAKIYIVLLTPILVSLITYHYFPPSPAPLAPLPPPAPLPASVLHLNPPMLTHIPGVRGGESLVLHRGDIVTGTLDGFLVGIRGDVVHWWARCPPRCRILGLRSHRDVLYGIDMIGSRVFSFTRSGGFTWILDRSTPGMEEIGPGFLNDLVIVDDVMYLTDSYKSIEGGLTMLQRFYSLAPDGRVLSYHLTSRTLEVFAEELNIPNGIELHRDNK